MPGKLWAIWAKPYFVVSSLLGYALVCTGLNTKHAFFEVCAWGDGDVIPTYQHQFVASGWQVSSIRIDAISLFILQVGSHA